MPYVPGVSTDPVEELRLRRWARENYVPVEARDAEWHAVVLDEMCRKDQEQATVEAYSATARRIVPLAPDQGPVLRGPHVQQPRTTVLMRLPDLS
jgi:hypothetical protein